MISTKKIDVSWVLNETALFSTQNEYLNMTNKKIFTRLRFFFLLFEHMHMMLFRVLRLNHTSIIFILIYIFFPMNFFLSVWKYLLKDSVFYKSLVLDRF